MQVDSLTVYLYGTFPLLKLQPNRVLAQAQDSLCDLRNCAIIGLQYFHLRESMNPEFLDCT